MGGPANPVRRPGTGPTVGGMARRGIRPFDESFYGTAGQMVENIGVTAPVRT